MAESVTLTIDNGPVPEVTAAVLDTLRDHAVPAIFFVVGQRLASPQAADLLVRMTAEGHRVGNHSMTHNDDRPLGVLSAAEIVDEVDQLDRILGRALDEDRLLRPWGTRGEIDRRVLGRTAMDHFDHSKHTLALWNVVPRDWENPDDWPDICLDQLRTVRHGVVVIHDLPTGAMRKLPEFIAKAQASGATFTTELPDDCVPVRRGQLQPEFAALASP